MLEKAFLTVITVGAIGVCFIITIGCADLFIRILIDISHLN